MYGNNVAARKNLQRRMHEDSSGMIASGGSLPMDAAIMPSSLLLLFGRGLVAGDMKASRTGGWRYEGVTFLNEWVVCENIFFH